MQIGNNAQEATSFIPTLYNTVKAANLSVSITCCDAEGWNSQRTFTTGLVGAGMEQYLGVITSHSYTSDPTSPINTKLPVWLTEAGPSQGFTTSWYGSGGQNEGMTWASKIAVGIVNANLSAYLFWEGYENKQQQSGSHLIDTDGTNAVPSGIFWAFTMWSRFIRPGAYRLAISGSLSGVLTGAFKNADGSLVVVLTNSGTSSRSTQISFDGMTPTAASSYLTDNSHKCDSTSATLKDGVVAVSVPGRSVVTVKLA
jgi:O-glycosyl hydrolase